MRSLVFFGLAAMVFAAASVAAAPAQSGDLAAGEVQIELRPQVTVPNRQVLLGDVAHVRTTELATIQRLVALPLGEAPRPGGQAVLERQALARWIRSRMGIESQRVTWLGVERTVVQATAQTLLAAQVEEVAREALQQWLQARTTRFDLEGSGAGQTLQLPPGQLTLKARPLPAGTRPAPRMVVWVDAWVDGAFVRAVAVAFQVEAYQQAWVATGDTPASALLQSPLVQQREVPITAVSAAIRPVGEATGVRSVRPLKAGDVLTTANTHKVSAVGRGEWVTLLFKAGPVQLEGRAEALQDGERGQMVRVRMSGATAAVEARVVERGRVEATP